MNNKRLLGVFLLTLVLTILTGLLFVQQNPSVTGQVVRGEVLETEPSFTNIEATVYYTVSSEDKIDSNGELIWHNPEVVAEYDVTTSFGYCVIPESRRGFYEDVKCQGSGVHNGEVYHHSTIKKTEAESEPLDEGSKFTQGITSTQTNPQKKHTVAVNPIQGSHCCINYDTEMYIDFGRGNEWNGVYVAEDTGSAFRGECKIDIYGGVGREELEESRRQVDSSPRIWLLDDDGYCGPSGGNFRGERGGAPRVSGTQSSSYSYQNSVVGATKILDVYQGFIPRVKESCDQTEYGEKRECFEELIRNYALESELEWNDACASDESFNASIVDDINSEAVQFSAAQARDMEYDEENKQYNVQIEDLYDREHPYFVLALREDLFEEGGYELDLSAEVKSFNLGEDLDENTLFLFVNKLNRDGNVLYPSSAEDILFNPRSVGKDIVREAALKVADCGFSEQTNCSCVFDMEDSRGVRFAEKKIMPRGSLSELGVASTFNVSRGSLVPDEENNLVIEDLETSVFNYLYPEGQLRLFKHESGEILALDYIPERFEACELPVKHELVCLGPGEDSEYGVSSSSEMRYTVQI